MSGDVLIRGLGQRKQSDKELCHLVGCVKLVRGRLGSRPQGGKGGEEKKRQRASTESTVGIF